MAKARRCPAGHDLGARKESRHCPRCRVEAVVGVAMAACPGLSPDAAAGAVAAVITSPAAGRDLAAAMEAGPDVLKGGAPPVVARLVAELRERGAALPEPTCSVCGRTGLALTRVGTAGLCNRCRAHQLAEACSGCGRVRVVVARDNDGGALCFACAPRPRRTCGRCGRVGLIARRSREGEPDICNACFRLPMALCRLCGRSRRCRFVAAGQPICASCSPQHRPACAHCGESRRVAAHWPEGPVCEPCYRAALRRRGTCASCGQERRLVDPPGPGATRCATCAGRPGLGRVCKNCGIEDLTYEAGRCVRCSLSHRATALLAGTDGVVAPTLVSVRDAIVGARQPYSAYNWLRSSVAATILAEIASGALALSHEALDAHPRRRAAGFLRQLLVANDALEPRDEPLAELEAWVAARLAAVADVGHRRVLRSYATWRVLRRARARATRSTRPRTVTAHAKQCLAAAIAFCEWLTQRGVILGGVTQGDIDAWAVHAGTSASALNDFLNWAGVRKLVPRLNLADRPRRDGPSMDDDRRLALVDRLLHDDDLALSDRVAGCLVLLYAQQLSRIVALCVDDVITEGDDVYITFGAAKTIAPEPFGHLLVELARGGRPYTGVGSPSPSHWLFPGLHPGRPLHPASLGARLRRIGVTTMSGRRSALLHLASRVPAAVLAEALHLHPTTAVQWTSIAGGDWSTYAAEVARNR